MCHTELTEAKDIFSTIKSASAWSDFILNDIENICIVPEGRTEPGYHIRVVFSDNGDELFEFFGFFGGQVVFERCACCKEDESIVGELFVLCAVLFDDFGKKDVFEAIPPWFE